MSGYYAEPTVTIENGPMSGERENHPAYGLIEVSRINGGNSTLFGSELSHKHFVRITISEAESVRSLSRDWHSTQDRLIQFDMSESQWVSFVASQGMGGTPITLRYKRIGMLEELPMIKRPETQHQRFTREMHVELTKRLEAITHLTESVKTMREQGKANKGDLSAIIDALESIAVGLPNTATFIHEQFQGSMDKTILAGKTEIESFVAHVALKTGLDALRNGAPPAMLEAPHD